MTILTADELAGLNFHDLGEAVRSATGDLDTAADEVMARATLGHHGYEQGHCEPHG